MLGEAFLDAFNHFLFREFHGLEELLHQRLVATGSSLDESIVHVLSLTSQSSGNVADGSGSTVSTIGVLLHGEHVDDTIEVRTTCCGELGGDNLTAEVALQVVDHLVVVTLVAVDIVDDKDDGLVELVSLTEVVLRADLNAVCAVDNQHGNVADIQRSHSAAAEVARARAVEHVELMPTTFHSKDSGEDGIAVLLLHGVAVADGILSIHGTTAANNAAF